MRIRTLAVSLAALAGALPSAALAQDTPQRFRFRFENVTDSHLPVTPLMRNSMDVGVADLDGDGDLDVVLPQEFRLNKLLINDGSGGFADASDRIPPLTAEEMAGGPASLQGRPEAGHDSEDVSIADLDGDGVLDIVIVAEDDVDETEDILIRKAHEAETGGHV